MYGDHEAENLNLVFDFTYAYLCTLKGRGEKAMEVAIKSYPTILHFVDICHFTISTFATLKRGKIALAQVEA